MAEEKTIIADASGMTAYNPPKRVRACLVQYNGTNLGKRHILEGTEWVIGRSPNVSIVVNEQSVSRQHARCQRVGDNIEIDDLGSSNGTYVNDKRVVGRQALNDGDIIRLGTILFKYFAQDNLENAFHDKIYRMATVDGGTQTFKREYLMESLKSEFKFSKTYSRSLSLIYFDLDFFKKVNDTYGHSAGDYILKETATLVKALIRKDDIFGRIGGEEFVLLLPNTDARTAYELAERIRSNMEKHAFKHDGKLIRQTLSMGVSQVNPNMKTPEDLLNDADKKLYLSKTGGRNRITV